MIKDLTFGQFYPCDSVIHRLDPRIKLILLLLILIFIFIAKGFISLLLVLAGVVCVLILTHIPVSVYFKNIKAILPILIFTFIINLFYTGDGNVLVQVWKIRITETGLARSVFMSARVILLILISSVLTYTTTPNDLTDALERLFSPLKFIGLGTAVHSLAMMMTIALRFIPTLVDETEKIINAQKARGADFESGSIINRIKSVIPILIPLLISAVRRAYDLAEAMESRCYNGGKGRQRMKQLKIASRDIVSTVLTVLWCVGIVLLKRY